MDDLISRAAAIAEIEEYIEEYSELEPETGYHNLKWCAMEEAKDVLSMLPAVDAVPVVHARPVWINPLDPGAKICAWKCSSLCSACGDYVAVGWKHCQNCGAVLDGERRDAE